MKPEISRRFISVKSAPTDKARTHVLPISQLGLMEMTRQRAAESLASTQFVRVRTAMAAELSKVR
jgi:Ribonuclease G/E